MYKIYFTFLFLLLSGFDASTQTNNIVFSVNGAKITSTGNNGSSLNFSYQKILNNWVNLQANFNSFHTRSQSKNTITYQNFGDNPENETGISFDFVTNFTPVHFKGHFIELGLGFGYTRVRLDYSDTRVRFRDSTGVLQEVLFNRIIEQARYPSISTNLNYKYYFRNGVLFGINLGFKHFFGGEKEFNIIEGGQIRTRTLFPITNMLESGFSIGYNFSRIKKNKEDD